MKYMVNSILNCLNQVILAILWWEKISYIDMPTSSKACLPLSHSLTTWHLLIAIKAVGTVLLLVILMLKVSLCQIPTILVIRCSLWSLLNVQLCLFFDVEITCYSQLNEVIIPSNTWFELQNTRRKNYLSVISFIQ